MSKIWANWGDSHLVEPDDLFTTSLPPGFGAAARWRDHPGRRQLDQVGRRNLLVRRVEGSTQRLGRAATHLTPALFGCGPSQELHDRIMSRTAVARAGTSADVAAAAGQPSSRSDGWFVATDGVNAMTEVVRHSSPSGARIDELDQLLQVGLGADGDHDVMGAQHDVRFRVGDEGAIGVA